MGLIRKNRSSLLLLLLCSCTTLPTGPSVNVMPAQGKPFELFQAEEATCRKWAETQIGKSIQETYDKNVAIGAVGGTALGAGLGAAAGSASGHAGAGAAVGAATGLLFGTAAGDNSGQVYGREAQHRYDNAYVECMYTYGNLVPEYRHVVTEPHQPLDVTAPPPGVSAEAGQYLLPPEISLSATPEFVYTPALNMYVAVGVPYDLLYDGTVYFYFYGGRWYQGPYYYGPWTVAAGIGFPPLLHRYRINEIRHLRDLEHKRYDLDRAHYDGRMHRPEPRGERQRH